MMKLQQQMVSWRMGRAKVDDSVKNHKLLSQIRMLLHLKVKTGRPEADDSGKNPKYLSQIRMLVHLKVKMRMATFYLYLRVKELQRQHLLLQRLKMSARIMGGTICIPCNCKSCRFKAVYPLYSFVQTTLQFYMSLTLPFWCVNSANPKRKRKERSKEEDHGVFGENEEQEVEASKYL